MSNKKVKLVKCTMLSMILGLAFTSAQLEAGAGPGANVINGTSGPDTLVGTAGEDNIHALTGNDNARGLASNDSVGGGSGNDALQGDAGRDYVQGGPGNDILDGSLDGVQDTLVGGGGGSDTFLFNTTQSGPDRILDFNEGGATPGDVVKLTNVTTAKLTATYSNSIEAGDPGVKNVGGALVIDFTPVSGAGSDTLTLTGLGSRSLAVGTDIVGS